MKRLFIVCCLLLVGSISVGAQITTKYGRPRGVSALPALPCVNLDFVQLVGSPYTTSLCKNGAWVAVATGAGVGTVTSFSAGDLSPLFTTIETNPTTTPALSFSLSNAAAHTFFGNNTGGSAAPGFQAIGTGDLPTGINAANIGGGGVSTAEYDFLGGVTSDIQTQLNSKSTLTNSASNGQVGISDGTNIVGDADLTFSGSRLTATNLTSTGLTLNGATSGTAVLSASATGGDLIASNAIQPTNGYFKAPSGTNMNLYTEGVTQIILNPAGNPRVNFQDTMMAFVNDNTYNIGAIGASRPATGYFGTSVVSPLFTGNVNGTITVADTTDTTSFVALFESATGDLAPKTDAALTYNAGTGALVANNLGLVAPNAGFAAVKTLQISAQNSLFSEAIDTFSLSQNAYHNGTNYKYVVTNPTTIVQQSGGNVDFYTAPSGSADANITFTSRFKVANAGAITLSSGITDATGTPGSLCYNTSTFVMLKNNALTCTVSSGLFKSGITSFVGSALPLIQGIQPVEFAYKDAPNRKRWGFIAEDVALVDRKLADGYDASGHPKSIDQNAILSLAIQGLKELTARVEALEAENRQLRRMALVP